MQCPDTAGGVQWQLTSSPTCQKLDDAKRFYQEKTLATSKAITKRNDELEEGDQQLDEVLSRAEVS